MLSEKLYKRFSKLKMWQWLIIGVSVSEILTFIISFVASKIIWGELSYKVLVIGIIDSLVVSFFIVSMLLVFIRTIQELYQKLEKRNDELSQAMSEIKTLRGILPICSYCKQIRNDKGYYEQIESYIHKQSGVDFSHTICPDCMKKNFPDLYGEAFKNESEFSKEI